MLDMCFPSWKNKGAEPPSVAPDSSQGTPRASLCLDRETRQNASGSIVIPQIDRNGVKYILSGDVLFYIWGVVYKLMKLASLLVESAVEERTSCRHPSIK